MKKLILLTALALLVGCHRHVHVTLQDSDDTTSEIPDSRFDFETGAEGNFLFGPHWIGEADHLFGEDLISQATAEDDLIIIGPVEIPIPLVSPGLYELRRGSRALGRLHTDGRLAIVHLSIAQQLGLLHLMTHTGAIVSLNGTLQYLPNRGLKIGDVDFVLLVPDLAGPNGIRHEGEDPDEPKNDDDDDDDDDEHERAHNSGKGKKKGHDKHHDDEEDCDD